MGGSKTFFGEGSYGMFSLPWVFHLLCRSLRKPMATCMATFVGSLETDRKRAEYCFKSTVSEERTHWVPRQTRWVLRKTRWVRFGTQIIGWKELTEFSPRNSVRPKKLAEFGVWNRTPRNRIRPVSELRLSTTCLVVLLTSVRHWRGSLNFPLSWPPFMTLRRIEAQRDLLHKGSSAFSLYNIMFQSQV